MVVCMHYCAANLIEQSGGAPAVRSAIAQGKHLTTLAFSEAYGMTKSDELKALAHLERAHAIDKNAPAVNESLASVKKLIAQLPPKK